MKSNPPSISQQFEPTGHDIFLSCVISYLNDKHHLLWKSMWFEKVFKYIFWHWELTQIYPLHDWNPCIWPAKITVSHNYNCTMWNLHFCISNIIFMSPMGCKNIQVLSDIENWLNYVHYMISFLMSPMGRKKSIQEFSDIGFLLFLRQK